MNIEAKWMKLIAQKALRYFGMQILPEQHADLYCRLQLRAEELHKTDLSGWLQQVAQVEWSAQFQLELLPVFTVGESYFCRDPLVMQWLSSHWLRSKQRSSALPLRIWSAGCCRGEEAYSLLFGFTKALTEAGISSAIQLFATDLNPEFIAKAQQGIYRASSFRNDTAAFRDDYFSVQNGQRSGRSNGQSSWQVQAKWRSLIRFQVLNLIEQQWPSDGPYDLIFCRNVLMYFSPEQAATVIRRFLQQLTADGLLLLNAVEASLATQAGLNGFWAGDNYALTPDALQNTTINQLNYEQFSVNEPPALSDVLQLNSAPILTPDVAAPSKLKMRTTGSNHVNRPVGASVAAHVSSYQSPSQQAENCLQQARAAADLHQLVQAHDLLNQALTIVPTLVAAYILSAQLYIQQQQPQLALQALQKAIYLEPDLIVAHLLKANLAMDAGQQRIALKELQLCTQLLQHCPAAMEVPYSDQLSAGQLYVICQQLTAEAL